MTERKTEQAGPEDDIVSRLRWDKRYTNGHVPLTFENAAREIERLQDAKRRALALADERGKEANAMRAALKQIADQREMLPIGSQYVVDLAMRALRVAAEQRLGD